MAVCGNPECPSPYFLKARKTQRFCDRPACSAYGQREHKRKWWSEHGEEWKQKREMVRQSRARKQRRGGRKAMTIFKRGKTYWYHFIFSGEHIQESTKQGNPRVARNMEAAHRTALAKGEVGFRE